MHKFTVAFLVSLTSACQEAPNDPLDPNSFLQYSATVTFERESALSYFDYRRNGDKVLISPKTSADAKDNGVAVLLIDNKSNSVTAISSATRKYATYQMNGKKLPGGMSWPFEHATHPSTIRTREALGEDSLDGHSCLVYKIQIRSAKGEDHDLKLWSARDLRGFPIRIESDAASRHYVISFASVLLDPTEDPKLFAIPPGYTNAISP